MYLTQTNAIRGLSKKEYKLLAEMCRAANGVYCDALESIERNHEENGAFLSYPENCKRLKGTANYSMLQASVSQQILKVADATYRGYFGRIRKVRESAARRKVERPSAKRGGMFPLIISRSAMAFRGDCFRVPVSRKFAREYGATEILIPFPSRIDRDKLQLVRILPIKNGVFFKIQYTYKAEREEVDTDKAQAIAIDLGVNNFASCITTLGTAFILDGRRLKSINQGWNKECARLQSIAARQGVRLTKRMARITEKRNNRSLDIMRKAARHIINYCIQNRIGTVIVGYNTTTSRKMRLGKRNNQTLKAINFGLFKSQLKCLCERYGMDYREVEESYTSKSSFYDRDELPSYGETVAVGFSGKRVHRGLYRTQGGLLVNADINGAANIMRKSKQNFDYEKLCSGLLVSPARIRLR